MNQSTLARRLSGALLLLTAASCAAQTVPKAFTAPVPADFVRAIYVDDDAAKGGDGSPGKPFATIGAALKTANPAMASSCARAPIANRLNCHRARPVNR